MGLVFVAARLRGQVGRSVVALLLSSLPVVLVVWNGVLLVRRDLCFVVHQLIFENVLTNNVSNYFSFLQFLPRLPCASARVCVGQVLVEAISASLSPRWLGEVRVVACCFLFVTCVRVCLFVSWWGL